MGDVSSDGQQGGQEQSLQVNQSQKGEAPVDTLKNVDQSASLGNNAGVNAEIQMPELLMKGQNQPSVTSEEKLWGLFSYVPLAGLIALIIRPDSAYVRLHGRQGALLFVIFFLSIFVYLFPFIGAVIGALIHLAVMVLGIFSMYQAFIGNWWKIPVLGDIAELIPIDAFTRVTREAVMGPGNADVQTPVQTPVDPGFQEPAQGEKIDAGEVQEQSHQVEGNSSQSGNHSQT